MSAAVAFASSSELSSLAGTPRIPCRSRESGFLLSWHYPLSPLYCSTVRPSTPSCSEELPLGRRYHPAASCSTLVVSHHLGGLLRATAASLLHPAASHGVRRVSRCRRPSHPRVFRPVDPFPATRFIPFKGFPSSIAVPHRCGRCPHAVGRQPPRPRTLVPTEAGTGLHRHTEVRWRSLRRTGRDRVTACRLRRDGSWIRTELRPRPPLELASSEEGVCPALAPAEADAGTSPLHRSAPVVRRLVLPHDDAQSRRSGPPRQRVPLAAPPK